ncbi:hypothetical protein DSO57_1026055 [Entomophthora muscae]|uniref:Uncharacterized protein n=1 Tax=Entomophthora muscae TaxID=34485 RepID=A0ACC2SRE0_9FUNG|nr:hypothetical protein DSO57_1026055 [Entomophthora muscae]
MRQALQQFKQSGIQIQESWLASQVQTNSTSDYQSLYNIFLNSDMKESCVPLDPRLISQLDPNNSGVIHHVNIFPQGVVLQLMGISDISKSLSTQSDIFNGIMLEEEAEKALDDNLFEPVKTQTKSKGKKAVVQSNSYCTTYVWLSNSSLCAF